jgi:hypothetical protein
MLALPSFDHSYLSFTSAAQPFVRADDVGFVVSEFMWFEGRPFYPIGALTNASVALARLSAGRYDERDEDNLDLIFQMREAEGGSFFEIVLRSHHGTTYGGWAWGRDLVVLPNVVRGHRVLCTTYAEERIHFEFCEKSGQYRTTGSLPVQKISFSKVRNLQDSREFLESSPEEAYMDRLP